jgi:hypothetical protein
MIQSLLADGFEVGNHDDVNGNTVPNCSASLPCSYTWAAFAAPTVNYRSIGINAATLYSGSASVTAGARTVTLAVGECLPASVGLGDKLTFPGPPLETLYILSRDSPTQLTVQGPAASTHSGQAYTITRAYTDLAVWESAVQGDLVADNRREVGVAYNDGPFMPAALVQINGSTTDATHHITLTVAPYDRHTGVAGTGVVLDGNGTDRGFRVQDDYTVLEWFELKPPQSWCRTRPACCSTTC